MKRTILLLAVVLLSLATIFSLAACKDDNDNQTPDTTTTSDGGDDTIAEADEVRILTLKGPTGMGMANVMNDAKNNAKSKYRIELFASPDLVKTEILLGNYDIAALPTNVAAALYNSGKADLQIAAVNTLGVLYILENGNTVTDIQSLKGKTIHATGGGSTPEYILRYVLSKNGIDPDKDVTLDFSYTDHAELAAHLTAGGDMIAMLPEPNVSTVLMNQEKTRVALDLTAEWAKVSDSEVMQGCIVVRRGFAEQYPEQFAKFLDEYRASAEFINQNVGTASEIIANLGIVPKAAIAKNAIPRCNIVYIEGGKMKDSLSGFLKVLYEASPSSVGGKLPDENLYYQK